MAFSSLGDRKQVQDAQFNNHLTGVNKESKFLLAHKNNSTQQGFRESENF